MSSNAPAPPALPKFPGVKRLTEDSRNFGYVIQLLNLVEEHRPHVNPGSRDPKKKSAWKLIFGAFFDRSQGVGRSFEVPGLYKTRRFGKEITDVIDIFASRHESAVAGVLSHSPLQAKAFSIQQDTRNALEAHNQRVAMAAATKAARNERLLQGQEMLGLNPPGRGVRPPSLPNSLTLGQQQGLAVLGQPTQSPNHGECNFRPSNFVSRLCLIFLVLCVLRFAARIGISRIC